MVKISDQKAKIAEVQSEIDRTQSPLRKRDLFKYMMRLKKELRECEMHMNGTYGKKAV